MIHSTATVPANPAGEARLTRDQVWKGLELKARDARLFLPPGPCTRYDVTENGETHFVREATIAGAELREIIMLEPASKVTFFQATGPREGAIVNELFADEAGELQLRFYCYLGLGESKLCRFTTPCADSSDAAGRYRTVRSGAPCSGSRRQQPDVTPVALASKRFSVRPERRTEL